MSTANRPVMPPTTSSIQAVLNLRGQCAGDLPDNVVKAIDLVRHMIMEGTHADGWKKVRTGAPSNFGRNFRSGPPAAASAAAAKQSTMPAFNRGNWNGAGSNSMSSDRIRNLRGGSGGGSSSCFGFWFRCRFLFLRSFL